jgi:hypothetical protein
MTPDRLLRPEGPWLHLLVATEADACDFLWSVERSAPGRIVARVLRGRKAATLTGLFDEFAAAFQFPYYFGENWDALDECLNDLEWLPADAYTVLITNAVGLLRDEPAEELRRLLGLLQRTAQEWSQPRPGPTPRPPLAFHALLHATPDDAAALRGRLQAAGFPLAPLF